MYVKIPTKSYRSCVKNYGRENLQVVTGVLAFGSLALRSLLGLRKGLSCDYTRDKSETFQTHFNPNVVALTFSQHGNQTPWFHPQLSFYTLVAEGITQRQQLTVTKLPEVPGMFIDLC